MKLADIDHGSRMVGDVDSKVVVSRGYSRRNRGTDPRPSAEAWVRGPRPSAEASVRGTVTTPVARNRVHPILLDVVQERRRHSRVAENGRSVLSGRDVLGG